ncbi:glycosyltransferase [Thiobacillus denitrificans]|uniref:glycosyltransferase n=1 Tax=Thiobacillus denitrificans TaxID=36861 RepID=UPI000759A186|nr:glycosyltransferase family 2 protein [Thiobacillus denitrificans]
MISHTEKMNTPRVSVVMAAYNAAAYLDEAVVSVLNQTMPNFELVVVDDGSTDATPVILARLVALDPRIVVHHQTNKGIGGATNQALKLARAPYVAILDSDDTMAPERLAMQADYLDAHADIAAVGSQWFTMSPQGEILGIDRQSTAPDTLFTLMFAFFAMHHPTIMARKEAILACGAYSNTVKQGCMDYGVFLNLLLAGYRMINLPFLLTRWRLNPGGATYGNARLQTEECLRIRARAFFQIDTRDRLRANQIARDLVRGFPAGSWFDEKLAKLIPDAEPSPALARWRELAAQGDLPDLEVQSVAWLHDELAHADALAEALQRASLPFLARLIRAKSGRTTPFVASLPNPEQAFKNLGESGPLCALSVLLPTQADDADLNGRIGTALESLPDDAEILVFATDETRLEPTEWRRDARVHFLPPVQNVAEAWGRACGVARGRYLAWLEPGFQHHPDFLAQSLSFLDSNRHAGLTYAVSEIYYPDALDPKGQPVKDPAPEPRWCQETLLGKDRGRLSCMVARRELLLDLPLNLAETGRVTTWALARCLLIRHRPHLLSLRNCEFAPPIRLGNNIQATLNQRLILWFFDAGLGSIPSEYAWADLHPNQVRQCLNRLDVELARGNLCAHPGNFGLLLHFILRFSPVPLTRASFRYILRNYPTQALDALRQQRPFQAQLGLAWWAMNKVWHKLTGKNQIFGAVARP